MYSFHMHNICLDTFECNVTKLIEINGKFRADLGTTQDHMFMAPQLKWFG